MQDASRHPLTLSLIGAVTLNASLIMEPGEFARVDLAKFGLPDGARILLRRYSSGKGFRPIEIRDDFQSLSHASPSQFTLYAYPDSERFADTEDFLGTYQYVISDHENAPLGALIEPFARLARGENELVSILLQAAVEEASREVIEEYVRAATTPKEAARFARNIRIMDSLRVLVPAIAHSLNLPPVRASIIDHIDTLREARNQTAHGHAREAPVTAEQAAAALFAVVGLHYIHAAQTGHLVQLPLNPN